MKWITREHVKVDRVAYPWLIKKFIDPQAQFLFVPVEQVIVVCMSVLLAGSNVNAGTDVKLKSVQTIPLDGVEGRIDHMAVDAKGARLYVAALGNDTVEVIDLKLGRRITSITGLKKPQGIAVVTDLDRVAIASGDDGKLRLYDGNQKLLGEVDGLDDADNVRYDAQAKLLYVGYGDGALAVIDPQKIEKVAEIKLDGHPESFQIEAAGNRIFVNVPSARQVAVIDREKRIVSATWKMKEAEANFPMALEEANHRLVIGCRSPSKLIVMDTESGGVLTSVDCCGDTDDVFFDVGRKQVYASGGEGCVSVIQQTDLNTYMSLGKITTGKGARTSLFVETTGMLYVAYPHRGEQKAELRVFATH